MFHIDVPENLEKAIAKCKNNADVKEVGIEWAIAQSKDLKAANVPSIHYYIMSRSENTAAIAREVF